MRVAHFSDLHVFAVDGVPAHRFANKRFTGWLNLRLKRGHKHRPAYVRAIAKDITRAKVDHVVITGDLTNLALEQEFEAVRALLAEELQMDARAISIVPGNHDLYTQGAMRQKRFTSFFAPFLESDLPELSADLPLGRFPYVHLRGPLAIIGLSTALPRLPLVASGAVGKDQLDALARILAHEEVKRRMPVILLHHPVHNPDGGRKTWMRGLADAAQLIELTSHLDRGLFLHGHLHERIQRPFSTKGGKMLSAGATSASLEHEDPHKMAGYNLYEFDGAGDLTSVEAHVLNPGPGAFHVDSVPKVV